MKFQFGSRKALIKYILLQLPVVVILIVLLIVSYSWETLSSKLMWILLVIWAAKDIVLYPFVWKAYDPQHQQKNNLMIGREGIASERLDPSGYVKVQGEIWQARIAKNSRAVEEGEIVQVSDINGLELIVTPVNSDSPGEPEG